MAWMRMATFWQAATPCYSTRRK